MSAHGMNDLSFNTLPEHNPSAAQAAMFLNELSFSVSIFSMAPEKLSNIFLGRSAKNWRRAWKGGQLHSGLVRVFLIL